MVWWIHQFARNRNQFIWHKWELIDFTVHPSFSEWDEKLQFNLVEIIEKLVFSFFANSVLFISISFEIVFITYNKLAFGMKQNKKNQFKLSESVYWNCGMIFHSDAVCCIYSNKEKKSFNFNFQLPSKWVTFKYLNNFKWKQNHISWTDINIISIKSE